MGGVESVVDPGAEAASLHGAVGVVMTEDKRVRMHADFVVRAPGYTMRVDQTSGVSYYLLDADGHRRHGYIHNTNFCFGIPALAAGDDQWVFRYRQRAGKAQTMKLRGNSGKIESFGSPLTLHQGLV